MNGDLQHIDDLFKSGLEGKEDSPSAAVWENIEKELDKKDSRPKFFLWWNSRKIAAAVLIFLGSAGLFAGGYYLRGVKMDNKETNNKPAEKSTQTSKHTEPVSPGTVADELTNSGANSSQKATSDQEKGAAVIELENLARRDAENAISEEAKSKPGSVNDKATEPLNTKEDADNSKPIPASSGISSGTKTSNKNLKSGKPAFSTASKTSVAGANNKKDIVPSDIKNTTAAATQADQITTGHTIITRSWEPEDLNGMPASRELPASEKTIHPSKSSGLVSNTPSSAIPSAIPVLNKRTASVDLPRFALTPVIAGQFGSNRIKADNSYPNAGKVKSEIDRTESQPSRIAGGLLADLRIAKNMTIQSGLVFTSRQIEIEPKYIKAERNADGKVRYKFDCSAGTYYLKKSTYARPGDSALTKFSTNELNYINIPLSLTYHFGGKKIHLFATAGAGLNILTNQYLETGLHNYNYDEDQSIATNLKSNYFNGMIGAGIDWRAFKKVSFIFSPQYQFGLTPMNENMPVKAYPRTFNMQMGMQIRL
ncbi:MAG TPA: outer membrane beta-barrel protein [Chitinophagaceae bacterium]|nr:outer membrane beta-barrel protein [Chitinophagaceae bacterium]